MQADKLYKISISGKVQGVFFRKNTAQKAKALNLAGTVQNKADGTVYIEAQGHENQLKLLIDWCKQGPPQARVTEVKVSEGATKNLNDFSIVH